MGSRVLHAVKRDSETEADLEEVGPYDKPLLVLDEVFNKLFADPYSPLHTKAIKTILKVLKDFTYDGVSGDANGGLHACWYSHVSTCDAAIPTTAGTPLHCGGQSGGWAGSLAWLNTQRSVNG